MSAKSVGNSLFNVVSGGKHSITPTDAIRTILSAGMVLTLKETSLPSGSVGFTAEAFRENGGRVSADGERLDETLHNLVKELLDEKVVERTDWSIPHGKKPMFSCGECAFESWIPYFSIDAADDSNIDAWIGGLIREKKKNGDQSGPIFLVVARDAGDLGKIAIGTLEASPMPPVGAVLTNRIRYTVEETKKLMALESPKGFRTIPEQIPERKPIGVLVAPKSNDPREFSFSSSGAGEPGKVGKISWEIRNDKDANTLVDSFAPLHNEPNDFYSVLKYRFLFAGTYRVRMIIRYADRGEVVRDLIVDVD